MFIDRVTVIVKAGDGGDGITSFIHYKGAVNGGPDGGDGGRGGNVIFMGDRHLSSLAQYYYKNKYSAENGSNGGPKNCFGKSGADLILKVPLGTVIRDYETDGIIADIFYDGQTVTVLQGGEPGKGNARFVNNRRHAPHFSQGGEKCDTKKILLEMKIIADVGLVGFPNVGKSTLLSKITKARPKIANYHFTTLSPNLGMAECYDKQFVVADIPGLIEGASRGAGLGIDFLKHIERTRLIIHVVDISGSEERDAYEDFIKINAELAGYSEKISKLRQIVAANKCDVFGADEKLAEFKKKIGRKYKVMPISAVRGEGLPQLLKATADALEKLPEVRPMEFEPYRYEKPDKLSYEILANDDGSFEIVGTLVDVLSRNVVISDYHSFAYMQKVLKDRGIFKQLSAMGAKDDTVIFIGGAEFKFLE